MTRPQKYVCTESAVLNELNDEMVYYEKLNVYSAQISIMEMMYYTCYKKLNVYIQHRSV